jgi:hypothetical protein
VQPLPCSRPTSTKKVYLDFDGCITTDTAWNEDYDLTITTPPYDIDSNTASFTTTEKANIIAIWRAVAEDYAPFDVDITTEQPGEPAELSRAEPS